jgi:hypothetical protein
VPHVRPSVPGFPVEVGGVVELHAAMGGAAQQEIGVRSGRPGVVNGPWVHPRGTKMASVRQPLFMEASPPPLSSRPER